MRVFSLVGKSGTGKSYQAGELCSKYGISSIVDDGLFIEGGRILAGISAKRQNTKVRAIKTALFTEEPHREGVSAQIKKTDPDSLLVIGTSDRMIGIITKRLGLPEPETRFDIEDLTTAEERSTAYRQRHELGKHVIPAPTFQIKKDFSGYFYHPIRSLRGMTAYDREDEGARKAESRSRSRSGSGSGGGAHARSRPAKRAVWDRSVVRPTYSYLGEFTISDKAIRDIVRAAGRAIEEVAEVPLILVHTHGAGAVIEIGVNMRYGRQIVDAAGRLQSLTAARIEDMTSINVIAVDVEIQGLT
jgi:uncharacterized alkaline shock family protein YloU